MASKSKIYFVMDLVRGGELFSEAFSVIDFCHNSGIYHRGLKTLPRSYTTPDNSFTVTARSKLSITIVTMFNMLWNLLEGLRIWIALIDGYGSERGKR
ncbi:hypothetical protein ACFX1R_049145 [Malus domestica]